MRLNHPIFTTPLRPKIEQRATKTPENYREWPDGKRLGDTMPMWTVQVGKLGGDGEIDYGIVSDPYGFEDSPDAEFISGGVNSKGPCSVALGRHGSMFLWGFAGDPTQMTESARHVFVNTICWMRSFDGAQMIVRKDRGGPAREWAQVVAGYRFEDQSGKPAQDYQRKSFDDALWNLGNGDLDKLEKVLAEKLAYLRYENGKWKIDEDLDRLGLDIRQKETLSKLAERLDGEEKELVRRVLARYAPDAKDLDAKAFRSWIAENLDRLFFSDVGGMRWIVGPANGGVK